MKVTLLNGYVFEGTVEEFKTFKTTNPNLFASFLSSQKNANFLSKHTNDNYIDFFYEELKLLYEALHKFICNAYRDLYGQELRKYKCSSKYKK